MTMKPFSIAVTIIVFGMTLIVAGFASVFVGVVVDDLLPFERGSEMLWMSFFGVGIGKFGMDVMWSLPSLNGGFLAWIALGSFTGLMCTLILASLMIPVAVVDVATVGESMVVEEGSEEE